MVVVDGGSAGGTDASYTQSGTLLRDNVNNAACDLIGFDVEVTTAAATTYFMLFDKATAPSNGDTAVFAYKLADTQFIVLERGSDFFGLGGTAFAAGLGWAFSSTPGTLTVLGAGIIGSVNFKFTE